VSTQIWPEYQSLTSFMEGSGESLIQEALANLFNDIREILYAMTNELLQKSNEVIENIEELSDDLIAYQINLVVDDKFIRLSRQFIFIFNLKIL